MKSNCNICLIAPTEERVRAVYTEECKSSILGINYNGNIANTKSGRNCQRWVSNTPHPPSPGVIPKNFPDSSIYEAENKCRNPDREPKGPWCYTMDPAVRWEYCDIPMCPGWF